METVFQKALREKYQIRKISIDFGEGIGVKTAIVKPLNDYTIQEFLEADKANLKHQELIYLENPDYNCEFSDEDWLNLQIESKSAIQNKYPENFEDKWKEVQEARFKEKPKTKAEFYAKTFSFSITCKKYLWAMLYTETGNPFFTDRQDIDIFNEMLEYNVDLRNQLMNHFNDFLEKRTDAAKKKLEKLTVTS